MNKVFFSGEELDECIRVCSTIADGLNEDIGMVRRIKENSVSGSKESRIISDIEIKLIKQQENIYELCEKMKKTHMYYENTEKEVLNLVKKSIFSNDDRRNIENIIIEKSIPHHRSMLFSNKALTHEKWFWDIMIGEVVDD